MELPLNQSGQSVDTPTQIRITACNEYPVSTGEIRQHDFKIRSTVSTVAASALL